MIIGYIENLRDKGRAHGTIAQHTAAILHFFVTLNDVPLNKRKITRFIPPDESTHLDKAYDMDDILRLLNACDIRTKVMVFLMVSTGMRVGALPVLHVSYCGLENCLNPSSSSLSIRFRVSSKILNLSSKVFTARDFIINSTTSCNPPVY
jgi:site-specific recombinase XerD